MKEIQRVRERESESEGEKEKEREKWLRKIDRKETFCGRDPSLNVSFLGRSFECNVARRHAIGSPRRNLPLVGLELAWKK